MPYHAEDYVHRIGRTGRAGRSGEAFTLVASMDKKSVEAIEKLIGQKIEWAGGEVAPVELESNNAEVIASREPREPRDGKRSGRRGGRGRRPEKQASSPERAENPPRKSNPEPKPAPKAPSGVSNDASQLPAFLLRPVNLKPREPVN